MPKPPQKIIRPSPFQSPLPYIVGGAALGAALSALPLGLAWAFLHPPRRLHKQTPLSLLQIPFERVRLLTVDKVRLSAWFVPAPVEQKAKGVVVICHGYHGNRERMLPHLAFLHRAGYHAVLFDFRAHGWSGGSLATFGLREPLDGAAVLDWVDAQPALANLPLFLLGESMGASVALLLAAADARVRAVVADSPYARFNKAVESRMDMAFGRAAPYVTPHTRLLGEKLLGVASDTIAPVQAVRDIAPRPVLLIQGQADRLVTPDNAREIQAAAPDTVDLWEVPDAHHVRSIRIAPDEYARRVLAFLDTALAPPVSEAA